MRRHRGDNRQGLIGALFLKKVANSIQLLSINAPHFPVINTDATRLIYCMTLIS